MSCDKIAKVSAVISNVELCIHICTMKFQHNGMKVLGNVIQNWER